VSDFLLTVGGARAAEFERVFGSTTVRVLSPLPQRIRLPDGRVEPCYLLDTVALRSDQRRRLVAHLAEQFGLPESAIDGRLDEDGMPIVARDADLTILNPQRWF
jgi:hypothetical protein